MLTGRFKFTDRLRLRVPDMRVEMFSVLNILLLFAILSLLNSRLILPVGIEISLPTTSAANGAETIGVITAQSENFIVFNGNMFSLDTLERGIKKYLTKSGLENCDSNAVLLRPDKSLPTGILVKICEIAKRAGYSAVQIATAAAAM